ncbi:MAG: metal-dependent phosphohydrolase [Rhodocyclaceae bacterium]|nr:metal-dependent phosphohydrolase [Rhodocyclaceae bacterium]
MTETIEITMDQLRVGLYVHLDLKWFEHPFAFNNFLIRTEEQVDAIRSLGLQTVRCDPVRSEAKPLAPSSAPAEAPSDPAVLTMSSSVLEAKRAMVERVKQRRAAAERIASAFVSTTDTIRNVEKNLLSRPQESVRQATELVARIADAFLGTPEIAIHVMGERAGGEEMYLHSLNVTLLAMMMARDIRLPADLAGPLGLGALFHDIGRLELPGTILNKMEPLTTAERHLYEMHCQYGVSLGQHLQLAPPVLAIIREHHELFDGSGYPARLQGEAIGMLSRIVAIADYYDELCNPANGLEAMTPHEALSVMFARLRSKFDPRLLQVFIRCLGVYPPGTIVQLSNGVIGMVATVNTARPLKPMVLVYDADIPKDEAILVDLERERDVNIAKAIRPAQLPREIYNYLSPRRRVSYYFDAVGPGQEERPQ